jgi:hypothetical protein
MQNGASRMKLREADKLDRKSRGSPSTALYPRLKAIEKSRFRPTYAGANMGHPDRVVYPGFMGLSMRIDGDSTR